MPDEQVLGEALGRALHVLVAQEAAEAELAEAQELGDEVEIADAQAELEAAQAELEAAEAAALAALHSSAGGHSESAAMLVEAH